ncbi:hypothetical protein HON59_03005 [bacterium]|jgi:hypothetical protein|nr:hypothetical protein [bacterium]MBT3730025.1 hypothetical protein [bacterium]MBT4895001.1 hypothetical protein [bacterium]
MNSRATSFTSWPQTWISLLFVLTGIFIMFAGVVIAAIGCLSEHLLLGGGGGISIIAIGVMVWGIGSRLPDILDLIKRKTGW